MDRGRSLTSTIPSVGSGTYSPGPNMARSPDEEGSNEECRCHHGPGLPRPQKPCYSVDIYDPDFLESAIAFQPDLVKWKTLLNYVEEDWGLKERDFLMILDDYMGDNSEEL